MLEQHPIVQYLIAAPANKAGLASMVAATQVALSLGTMRPAGLAHTEQGIQAYASDCKVYTARAAASCSLLSR
jgi:hypothetical protein